jgi:hypothetical protein
MSHNRKQRRKREEQRRTLRAEKIAAQNSVVSRTAVSAGEVARMMSRMLLLSAGLIAFAGGLIAWTSSLVDRAVPMLIGLAFLGVWYVLRRKLGA